MEEILTFSFWSNDCILGHHFHRQYDWKEYICFGEIAMGAEYMG